MIVDTSALIAILGREPGAQTLADGLAGERSFLPAPTLVEFRRVVSRSPRLNNAKAEALLADLLSRRMQILSFDQAHADAASVANAVYGIGNTRGGTLNLLDLMVYACAKVEGRPILCTGRDFAATDADIHPASRTAN